MSPLVDEARQIEWEFVSGHDLEIYYYGHDRPVAEDALQYLEPEVERVTDLFGYQPYSKIKVYLYASQEDLRKDDVATNKFSGQSPRVPHIGTTEQFREALLRQTTSAIANKMMFEENLTRHFSRSQLNLPDWFADGAAAYAYSGWSDEMDSFVHRKIANDKVKSPKKLSGKNAELMGQSIWNYVAEKYGRPTVATILNYTRVTRNEEKSILEATGINFEQLLVEWRKFYSDPANRRIMDKTG